MMRCKACNAILEPNEIIYDEETEQHEDLCFVCRDSVVSSLLELEEEDAILGSDDYFDSTDL